MFPKMTKMMNLSWRDYKTVQPKHIGYYSDISWVVFSKKHLRAVYHLN
jgi:hypothetical protein